MLIVVDANGTFCSNRWFFVSTVCLLMMPTILLFFCRNAWAFVHEGLSALDVSSFPRREILLFTVQASGWGFGRRFRYFLLQKRVYNPLTARWRAAIGPWSSSPPVNLCKADKYVINTDHSLHEHNHFILNEGKWSKRHNTTHSFHICVLWRLDLITFSFVFYFVSFCSLFLFLFWAELTDIGPLNQSLDQWRT